LREKKTKTKNTGKDTTTQQIQTTETTQISHLLHYSVGKCDGCIHHVWAPIHNSFAQHLQQFIELDVLITSDFIRVFLAIQHFWQKSVWTNTLWHSDPQNWVIAWSCCTFCLQNYGYVWARYYKI